MIPLPEPFVKNSDATDDYDWWSKSAMLAYGRACAAAERERCAQIVESARVAANWNEREALAKMVRALKDE